MDFSLKQFVNFCRSQHKERHFLLISAFPNFGKCKTNANELRFHGEESRQSHGSPSEDGE